jgi:hypothetical protein
MRLQDLKVELPNNLWDLMTSLYDRLRATWFSINNTEMSSVIFMILSLIFQACQFKHDLPSVLF